MHGHASIAYGWFQGGRTDYGQDSRVLPVASLRHPLVRGHACHLAYRGVVRTGGPLPRVLTLSGPHIPVPERLTEVDDGLQQLPCLRTWTGRSPYLGGVPLKDCAPTSLDPLTGDTSRAVSWKDHERLPAPVLEASGHPLHHYRKAYEQVHPGHGRYQSDP